MHAFSDPLGRRWKVVIDPPRAALVRRDLGVDLPALLAGDMAMLSALLQDPPMLSAVLHALCQPQGIGLPEWSAVLTEPGTADAATAALGSALIDAYRPDTGLSVRSVSRHDRALATLIDRGTRDGFDTTTGRLTPRKR